MSAEPFSDEDGAQRFADRHLDELRRCEEWSRWLVWDGTRWQPDSRLAALAKVRMLCADMAGEARDVHQSRYGQRLAFRLCSAVTVSAVERLARADQRWAIASGDLDRDPWALNTPAGTVDLRTGELRPHRRADLLSKITSVAPAPPGTAAPVWSAFLKRVLDGDGELAGYIQRLLGYALTGDTSEEMFAFAHGTGANGKSTLFGAITSIMGDYAMTAQLGLLMASSSDRHETELAQLVGRRLVIASEVEADRRWAETRIKALTGRDRVRARFMRQDHFEFDPVAKFIVFGNHRPNLADVDEAMRRRLHLIPFTVTIPAHERDPDLRTKLLAEAPAVLRWVVDGCIDWQAEGLRPPAKVQDATTAYFEAQDTFAGWLAEATERDDRASTVFRDLYDSWKQHADRFGEAPGSAKAFSAKLEDHGFSKGRLPSGIYVFRGLRVTFQAASPRWAAG